MGAGPGAGWGEAQLSVRLPGEQRCRLVAGDSGGRSSPSSGLSRQAQGALRGALVPLGGGEDQGTDLLASSPRHPAACLWVSTHTKHLAPGSNPNLGIPLPLRVGVLTCVRPSRAAVKTRQ